MLNEGSNDKRLSKIMKKSMLRMPFTDFEDKVMLGIHKQTRQKKTVVKDTRLSCLFFLLGTGFGLSINYLLSHASQSLMGFSPEQILLFFQVSYVFLFLTQLEKIFTLIYNLRNN